MIPLSFISILFVICFAFLALPTWAQKSLPQQINQSERIDVTKTLGLSTSGKILSNPYPLGGHQGVEMGVSVTLVDTSEFESFGCQPEDPGCPTASGDVLRELNFTRFHLGKGLYNNVDLYFHFSPPIGDRLVQDFGGLVRWGFFQSDYTPTQLSLVLHGNQFNYADRFKAQTLGGLIMAGVNVPQRSVYFAIGYASSKGQFTEGNQSETAGDFHSLIGATLEYQPWFIALQIDRYKDIVYSAKIGMRL